MKFLILFACESCDTQGPKDPCLESPLDKILFSVPRSIRSRGATFDVENLREFKAEFGKK
jgi:hypothetical protein